MRAGASASRTSPASRRQHPGGSYGNGALGQEPGDRPDLLGLDSGSSCGTLCVPFVLWVRRRASSGRDQRRDPRPSCSVPVGPSLEIVSSCRRTRACCSKVLVPLCRCAAVPLRSMGSMGLLWMCGKALAYCTLDCLDEAQKSIGALFKALFIGDDAAEPSQSVTLTTTCVSAAGGGKKSPMTLTSPTTLAACESRASAALIWSGNAQKPEIPALLSIAFCFEVSEAVGRRGGRCRRARDGANPTSQLSSIGISNPQTRTHDVGGGREQGGDALLIRS